MVRYQSNADHILYINGLECLKFKNTFNKIKCVEFGNYEENLLKNKIKNNFFIIKDGELAFALYDVKPIVSRKDTHPEFAKWLPIIRKTKCYE